MGERKEIKFKVGDRVKCIRNIWHTVPILNECGTVCEIRRDDVGINFDKDVNGHSCSGHCENGHGWYLLPNEIELVTPAFKVGDRVVGIGKFDNRNIDGKLGTVVKITNDGIKDIGVEFDEHIDGHSAGGKAKDGHGWWVEEFALKLVEETPKWKVLIMPDGDKTTGRLYENGKVVKSVETKKHSDDEYSIDKACEVIMERLFPTPKLLDKFEEGKTYVFSEKLHDLQCGVSSWSKGLDGTVVIVTSERNGQIGPFGISPEWCEEVTEPPKPTYYNGKVVCVGEPGIYSYTKGKIYDVVDGKITLNNGNKIPVCDGATSFEELKRSLYTEFIEVVE